jgi:hypothetical protein
VAVLEEDKNFGTGCGTQNSKQKKFKQPMLSEFFVSPEGTHEFVVQESN